MTTLADTAKAAVTIKTGDTFTVAVNACFIDDIPICSVYAIDNTRQQDNARYGKR